MGRPWSVTGMLASLGIGSAGVGSLFALTASAGTSELVGTVVGGLFVASNVVVL